MNFIFCIGIVCFVAVQGICLNIYFYNVDYKRTFYNAKLISTYTATALIKFICHRLSADWDNSVYVVYAVAKSYIIKGHNH